MATVENLNIADTAQEGLFVAQPPRTNWLVDQVRRVPRHWWKYLLVLSDALLILVAFLGAYYLRYQAQLFLSVDPAFQQSLQGYWPLAFSTVVVVLVAFRFSRVYPYQPGRAWLTETWRIATASTAGMMFIIVASLAFRPMLYSRLVFLYTAVLVTILLGISRLLILWGREYFRHYDIGVQRVLLVGAGNVGRMVMRTVAARPDYGLKLVGFLDDDPAKVATDIGRFKALGAVETAGKVIKQQRIDRVIICLPWQSHGTIQRLLRECEQMGVAAYAVPDLFLLTKNQMRVEELNGIPLLSTRELSIRGWNAVFKRGFDVVVGSLMALIALLPGLLIAAAIRLETAGPVLFSQVRVGKNGRPFRCYKFRSMVPNADQLREQMAVLNESSGPLFKIRNDPRLTRVGRFIRRYSLDELPQLINVLRGEMSLIGPRPNLPSEVEQYQDWMTKRLSVCPGLTGLWQVSGRSDLTFDEMVLLDIYYVENWTMGLDLNILLRSVPAVIQARGAY
jgi:exopolysaccharide biosynthesis polyprenyl glycosylphosphotransferase